MKMVKWLASSKLWLFEFEPPKCSLLMSLHHIKQNITKKKLVVSKSVRQIVQIIRR